MPRSCSTVFITLLVFGVCAAAERPPEYPVRAFVGNPKYSSPRLSDDGETIAVIHADGDLQLILARGLAGKKWLPLARLSNPETRLSWLEWANDRRLLISAQARDFSSANRRSRMTRLFGVDRDGKNFRWLGERWPVYGQNQRAIRDQDRIVHWTPRNPGSVLIEIRPPYQDKSTVMRMNVDSGRIHLVQGEAHDIGNWFADVEGSIRAGEAVVKNRYQLWARTEPDGRLVNVIEHGYGDGGPVFAGFHANPRKIYVEASHEGRSSLYEFDLGTREIGPLVFTHPLVDFDTLQREPGQDRRVVGVRFTLDRPEIHFFDETAAREHQALRRDLEAKLATPVFHEPVSHSANGVRQILRVSSEIQSPVYFFYHRETRQLTRLLDQRPELDPGHLAPTRRMTYQARDGRSIPAYLTVPRGSEAKRLPTIALIHGGPWARDSIRWDPEVQLLANRGFAVFQMNFRGSTGYGREHLRAGYREWGQKIQDDITDGIRWLIAEGVADPGRIGIAGASFGGYAVLVGLVKTPELYRAGVAYAPVTDIELLLGDDKWYKWRADWHRTMVGGGREDKRRLRESSPLRRAREIRAPVLLGHGEDDQRIHVRQSRRMADALRKAGKKYEYLEFPNEVHGFLLEANRVKWYERLVSFFEEHLAAAPRPPAAAGNGPQGVP